MCAGKQDSNASILQCIAIIYLTQLKVERQRERELSFPNKQDEEERVLEEKHTASKPFY